jgi:hypothetical protein
MKKRTLPKYKKGGDLPKLKDNIQTNKSDNTRTNYAPVRPRGYTPDSWATNINEIQPNGRPNPNIPGLEDASLEVIDAIGLINPLYAGLGGLAGLAGTSGEILIKKIMQKKALNQALSAAEKEYLHTIRTVGYSFAPKNMDNLSLLEKSFSKAQSLSDETFEKLTGFSKEKIQNKINDLKANSSKVKVGEDEVSPLLNRYTPRVNPRVQELRRNLDEVDVYNQLAPPPSEIIIPDNITRYNLDDINNYDNVIDEMVLNNTRRFSQEMQSPTQNREMFSKTKRVTRNSFDVGSGIANKLFNSSYKPISYPKNTQSLIGSLGRDNDVVSDLRQALKTVNNAPSGSSFIGSGSLSTDSYPLTAKAMSKMISEGKGSVNFAGESTLNTLGFNSIIDGNPNINLKEINGIINDINKVSKTKIPFAKKVTDKDGYYLTAPDLVFTKYPNGGKIYNPNNANSDLNFLNWYKNNTIEGKRGVPYSNELDYDYFSFYKNKGVGNINNHFPDTYKLPNHETFSNESLYAGNGTKGYWDKNKFIKYQDGGQIMKEKTLPEYKKGGLIKRADGSYSKRGLWDNIRDNAGSGKKPTKEMLKQERKIKAKMEEGGVIYNPGFNALPKEVQENIIANMAMGGYIYSEGGSIHIKPENKGKFTSWAKSHGMGVQEAASHVMANKEDYSSTIVKRANFAKNASKWKHQDGGTVKRSLNQYSQGGDMTGPIQLGAMVGNLALGAVPDNEVTDAEGNALGSYQSTGKSIGQGALTGAAAGSVFGPVGTVVGGLVGGAAGYFQGKQQEDEMKKVQAAANNNIMSKKRIGGPNSPITTMPTNVNNMYPYGGTINDDQPGAIAELELQEQMQLPDGTVMGVDGPSHEQGGIEVNVPEGTRVFSDRLKNGKRTFAQDAKSINSKIAKLDKKPDSQAKSNTEMLFNKQLDNLFNTQEEMKIVKEQKRMFSKGGTIPPAHNGMYPAHNVRIMKHGGLIHYDGIDGRRGIIEPIFGVRSNPPKPTPNILLKAPNINNGKPFTQSQIDNITGQGQNPVGETGFNVSPQQMGYATQGLTNLIQNQQINKVKAPRSIGPVTFSAGRSPEYVDYSAERAAIDAETAAARKGVNLGSGSYSTQAANLQKIMNQKMMGKGRSFQTQENANKQLNNAYSAAQAAAYNQGVQTNLGIDQYNLENLYNYDLWKAGNRMKATGSMGDNMTNMFNNEIARDNQLAYYEMMSRMYEDKIAKDIAIKKYGGTIKKRSLKK